MPRPERRAPRTSAAQALATLEGQARRLYPTAERVILHRRLILDGHGHREVSDDLAAFDPQGRALIPLRPDEVDAFRQAMHQHFGGGLMLLFLPTPTARSA